MYWNSRHLCSINWGSISQSRFICQVWCTGIQSIYSQFTGGPSAKVCSSANFGVLVFKASLLYYPGGPLAKVCLSVKFGVLVFKASIRDLLGVSIDQIRFICQIVCTGIQGISALLPKMSFGQSMIHLPNFVYCFSRHLFLIHWGYPLAKVGSSAKFWCTGIQGIYALLIGVSISQSRFICQVWCRGIQGIYSQFTGGPSAKVCLSAKFGVLVFKASMLFHLGVGVPSTKVGSSAKFGVLVFKASMLLIHWGVH